MRWWPAVISRRIVTFSNEAGWGSNGMQESQALYWAVDTGELVLCLRKAEVCVRCSCPGDAMGACYCCWRWRRRCRVTKTKFNSAASEAYYEVALDRFAGSRGSQFSTAWVARQVQGSQLQAARVWSDAAGLGFSGPSFSCGLTLELLEQLQDLCVQNFSLPDPIT